MTAFWNHGIVDHCMAQITVPRDHTLKTLTNHPRHADVGDDLLSHWTDGENIVKRYLSYFENTLLLGDAIPVVFVDLGPGSVAAYLGSEVTFRDDTVWFAKVDDFTEDKVEFKPDNKWWQLTKEITKYVDEKGKDKYYTLIADLGGVIDIQGHLRGVEDLLIDCVCTPENVDEKEKVIMETWKKCFLELSNIVDYKNEGMVNWMNLWAPGTTYVLQSDLSYNISNDMFKRLFLPRIEEQCQYIDYPLYHLDGERAIRHLDSILQIPELKGLQWEPGFGGGEPIEYIELLKKIQNSGKSLIIRIKPEDINTAIKHLSPEGLCLATYCKTSDEAEKVLESIEKWDR